MYLFYFILFYVMCSLIQPIGLLVYVFEIEEISLCI